MARITRSSSTIIITIIVTTCITMIITIAITSIITTIIAIIVSGSGAASWRLKSKGEGERAGRGCVRLRY